MNNRTIRDRLTGFKVFSKWSQDDLERLAQDIEVVDFPPGETIFAPERDGQADDAYVIDEGRVRQSLKNAAGQEWSFRTLGPGEAFIEQALFRGQRHAATAKAETDSVLFRIPAVTLSWALNRYPELWKALIRPDVAARLRAIPLLRSLSDEEIERLAESTESQEFEADRPICRVDDEEGNLWLIDWGQVKIVRQEEVGFAPDGKLQSAQLTEEGLHLRSFPERITAGDWFVGGVAKIQGLFTVEAKAATKVKLLRVPAHVLEPLADRFQDVNGQLQRRLNVLETLRQALEDEESFRDLGEPHWRQMASVTGQEHIPKGLAVTRQGEKLAKLYVLVAGSAVVRASDDEGRERPRHVITPLAFVGANALLRGDRRHATVRAIGAKDGIGGADWLTLHREDLRYMMKSDPRLWRGTELRAALMEKRAKKRFDWMEDEETVEFFGRRHWLLLMRNLLAPFLLPFVATALWTLFNIDLGLQAYLLGLIVFWLLTVPIIVIDYIDDYYVVTNRRVTRRNRTIFLHEDRKEATLERLEETTITTSLVSGIFGYGDLKLQTAAQAGAIVFRQVPNPEQVRGVISAQQRQVKAGQRAEQREAQRHELVKRLRLRTTPHIADRVLPAGIEPPARNRLESLLRSLANRRKRMATWLAGLPKRLLALLLWPLPEPIRKRALQDRKKKAKKKPQVEKVYRKHPIFLLFRTAAPLAASLVLGAGLILFERGGQPQFLAPSLADGLASVLLIAFIVSFLVLVYQFEDWRNDKYVLTKTHIIDVEALPFGLREQARQASWARVQNATYELPTFWANLLDFGTVIIQTAATEGEFDFVNVPHPRLVQQEIFRRMEEQRQEKEAKEAKERRALLNETLEVYDELMQEKENWPSRQEPGQPSV